MAAITATCTCHSSCCLWCATCHAISQSFNKTVHLHTGHVALCDFLSRQHPLSFLQICGRRIAPVNYEIWGDIQQRVHQSQLHSIDELKNRLLNVWHGMDQSVIDDAIDGWHKHLRAKIYRQKVDILSSCCKLDNSIACRTVWQDIFCFIKHCICNLFQIWTLTFHG